MTDRTPRRWRVLLVAAAGLCVAWLAFPVAAPLYDGVGFPDEPYRYVSAPPGSAVTTQPPTAATGKVPVANGTTEGFQIASAEQGPQVSVFVPTGTLRAPAGAHAVTLRADPRAPSGPVAGRTADGNVYRLTASTDAGVPTIRAVQDHIELVLRATSTKQPGPVMLFQPAGGHGWSRLATARYGTDVYAGQARGYGDYALVFGLPAASSGPAAAKKSGGGTNSGLIIGVGVAVLVPLLVAIVVAIRLSRTRRAA